MYLITSVNDSDTNYSFVFSLDLGVCELVGKKLEQDTKVEQQKKRSKK